MIKILIVDDSPRWRDKAKRILEEKGFDVVLAESMRNAFDLACRTEVSVLLASSVMAFEDDARWLDEFARSNPKRVVVLSDSESVSIAVRVFKHNVEFLSKPLSGLGIVGLVTDVMQQPTDHAEWFTFPCTSRYDFASI